jgi:two-component system, NarL family, sensor histidine kinase UhpB
VRGPDGRIAERAAPTIARGGGGKSGAFGDERQPEAQYRTLLEQIPAIVYIWGVEGGLDQMSEGYVSPQIESVLGFRPDEWIADPHLWVERLHPEDREEVLDETRRSLEAGEPFKLEYRMVARDGRVVWLHDVASVLACDHRGRVSRYQGVQLDITARKEAEHAQRRGYERLRVLTRQRKELMERLVETQEEERRRISEGIHDDSMQGLFVVLNRLNAAILDRPELGNEEALTGLRDEVHGVIDRLRRLAFELHPRILDAEGLHAALRFLIARSTRVHGGVAYRLEDRLAGEPSKRSVLGAYRIAQEALSNAGRHSSASSVTVLVEDRDGGVLIRVEDDGSGFDVAAALPSREHIGLVSMRERAEMLGGSLRVDSVPGVGTTVEGWIPASSVARSSDRHAEVRAHERGSLTRRENEVADLLALGHTNKEISEILHLSVRTVEHHRSHVFQKLGVRSRAGLVHVLRREDPRGSEPDH